MEEIIITDSFRRYLFAKGYFVASGNSVNAFEAVLGLAEKFNIIVKGEIKCADVGMIKLAETELRSRVPEAFYKDFPQSVKELSKDKLLFDQLYAYFLTYGLGEFDQAKHSVFEQDVARAAFDEETEPKYFTIVSESDAKVLLCGFADELLCSTRPLSKSQYELVRDVSLICGFYPKYIASKNTAIKLLLDTTDDYYTKFLCLPDVIKVVEELNYSKYNSENIKKLNLKNKDRKFISQIINKLADRATTGQLTLCEEKRKAWKGLLHHIHYKAHTAEQASFTTLMWADSNTSVMHFYEAYLQDGNVVAAAAKLHDEKGSAAVLRVLNRLLCRCTTDEEFNTVINYAFDTHNTVILLQLLYLYDGCSLPSKDGRRTFSFTKFNRLKTHNETKTEAGRRQTFLTQQGCNAVKANVKSRLEALLKGRIGKVYIDEAMKTVGIPLQETAGNIGYGVFPRGTRMPLNGKTVRCFTYWEKVNDIDISAIGITEDGKQVEFSWRTFNMRRDMKNECGYDGIVFSGDQTSGYNGGSEFIDIELDVFKAYHPEVRYVVFCDNVFSGTPFDKCICRAGYMLRENPSSGEIFEPKTVKSSFAVMGDSTFAYMFALDITTDEFVWLNVVNDSDSLVAGANDMGHLVNYINICNVFNLYDLFVMLASQTVKDVEEADVVVSDNPEIHCEGKELIRSTNAERIMQLIN